jgi:hypothetical protein
LTVFQTEEGGRIFFAAFGENYSVLGFYCLTPESLSKKTRNSGGRFYEIGLVGWAGKRNEVKTPKRNEPIISASTRGIDGHGLSAFAHPTSSDFLGCGR